ncbi:MAG: Rpn family recombination-promoting nuclease/putative transposase [Treponema sp.]|nr:Rpn family recombination-promoting nuclease/putative transposase [Treponema sp.]
MTKKNLTPEELWNQATIANNFIFYKIMRNNPDLCKELLEILLSMEIDHIEIHGEEEILIDYESRGIRLDVYAKNEENAFNIEMQAINTKELPERARFYQGVIDVDLLKTGEDFRKLKDTYVIFICIEDIFKKELPLYRFQNFCVENKDIALNDRTYKYFFISNNCDKLLDERQKAFLKLVTSNKPTDDFSRRIAAMVKEAKTNLQWRRQFMDLEREKLYARREGFEDGLLEGKLEGISQGKVEAAVLIVKDFGVTPELASEKLGVPLDKLLEKLNEENK